MAQTWHDLLFAHWPLPPARVAALIPPMLSLDTFDGDAWVGVVPFHMTGIRLRGLPPIPGTSALPEINLRTYVSYAGRPGVYFFSLDAGSALAVAVARRWFHLPYFRAAFEVMVTPASVEYHHRRRHRGAPDARFEATYRPIGDVLPFRAGSLERWLSERYCLYAVAGGRVFRAEIHHAPWPLQRADADLRVDTLPAAHGMTVPSIPPLLHFSRRQDVRIWGPERVDMG
jgi:uncharacterized protein